MWRETKDAGKQAFTEGEHGKALALYSEAIEQLLAADEEPAHGGGRGGHTTEHQVLLSNVIACRLKIGGPEMTAKAVAEAEQVRVPPTILDAAGEARRAGREGGRRDENRTGRCRSVRGLAPPPPPC